MLMANCLINLFGLFYCHSFRSSSRCKMANWCVCLFTDMPLRLVSSALSSPLSSGVSVPLSAQNMVISESSVLLYAYAYIMHSILVLICLYVGCLWGHEFIWTTQRHHIPVLSFTLLQFDFLAPLADLFICAYRNALHRQSSESGCMCGDGLCCDCAIFYFSLRQMSVIFPALSSSALFSEHKRWSPAALLTLLFTFVHICTYTRGSFAVLLFPSSQEWALDGGWNPLYHNVLHVNFIFLFHSPHQILWLLLLYIFIKASLIGIISNCSQANPW